MHSINIDVNGSMFGLVSENGEVVKTRQSNVYFPRVSTNKSRSLQVTVNVSGLVRVVRSNILNKPAQSHPTAINAFEVKVIEIICEWGALCTLAPVPPMVK